MNVIIVGAGKVGETLVEQLAKENHDVMIVDTDSKTVEYVVNKYDVMGIVGGGCEREILVEAGTPNADFFIACTSKDELNILSCMLAKKMGAKYTIARVRDPEYFSEMEYLRSDMGLDMCFNPEYRTAEEMLRILKFPSATNIESFAGGKVLMLTFNISAENPMVGQSLADIVKDSPAKVLFAMIQRGEEILIPRGNFIIKKNDAVYIVATEQDIIRFCKKMRFFKPRAKSVFIIGGGKISYYLAQKLIDENVSVKIIESEPERAKELASELKAATVICADGTNQETLDEEVLKNSDACVTLTGVDEENIIISLYAAMVGVDKVITKIDRKTMIKMTNKLGLDTVLSPRAVIANHIIQFIRSNQSQIGGSLTSLYKLHEKAEALEFTVRNTFGYCGIKLKDLKIKHSVIVCGIVRNNEFILPSGETTLAEGDNVLIITTQKRITDLSQIIPE